jgi:hypothetical protein
MYYLSQQEISCSSSIGIWRHREYPGSLNLSGVKDCLDTIDFLDTKIQEMDNQIKILANNDKYAKHLITIPDISYYALHHEQKIKQQAEAGTIRKMLNICDSIKWHMSVQTDAATQDIQIKYDEFQKSCENILPKVDPKLIEDFLFRERENSDIKPRLL